MARFERILPQSFWRRLGLFFAPHAVSKNRFARLLKTGVLILIFSAALFAQSSVKVQGVVLDDENRPLPGANVQILGSALGAAADASGRFAFENLFIGDYTLRITHVGYEAVESAVTVAADSPVRLTVRLRPRALQMPPVQVTAERQRDTREDVLIITRADIRRAQSASLGDLLQNVGGLEVRKSGGIGARETVSIRGSNANQVLVTLDGVRLNDELTGEVDLSQVPLNIVERVEVYKGGGMTAYGGAVGGVIALFTLKGGDNRLQLASHSGSFGLWRLEPSWSRRGRVDVTLSAQSVHSRGDFGYSYALDDRQIVRQGRVNADITSNNLFVQAGTRIGASSVQLKAHRFESERGQPGSVFYPTPYARSQVTRTMASASSFWEKEKWTVSAQLIVAHNTTACRNEMPQRLELPFGPVPQFAFSSTLRSLDARAEVERRGIGRHRFGLALRRAEYEDVNLRAASAPIGHAAERTPAAFWLSQFGKTLGAFHFSVDPSLRFEHSFLQNSQISRAEQQWSPQVQLYAAYGGKQRLFVKAALGRAFRTPTFADLFYQDFRVQGQADLLPEKSRNREWTLGGQARAFGVWRAEVRQFHNRVDDLIVWRLGSFEFFRPFNTDAELSGWEAQLNYAADGSVFGFDLFYTDLQPLNKNPNQTLYNKRLPYRAKETWSLRLNFKRAGWQSSLLVRHAGERFVNEANTKSLPAYGVVDWNVSRRIMLAQWEITLQCAVYNALDERYELVRDMPLPGREFRLGLIITR